MQTVMNQLPPAKVPGDRQGRLRAAGANNCGRNNGEEIDCDDLPRHAVDRDGVVGSRVPANICAGCIRSCAGRVIVK